MESIKREEFEEWARGCNWFKVREQAIPNGQQHNYVTPHGEVVLAQYNSENELTDTLKPVTVIIQQAKPMGGFPINLGGKGPFPGMPQG